ncbi:mandelate racemase/muconate lactonizing enzyme family protein [Conexibacter sp. JD483]|uniref:mandelate racemase/muconate lactonizing enzyme family protein n=1 Tax=unclassified Conexibacter TaxID=2627773 RepID=UPI002724CDF2|nr:MULTISPECIES: mandelate racemase/muconate lactonizing enzyme family protein [unclassified Conexibacter]MDO8186577.1 mandelate racemase/muconate lactonizing enzyme family protein [Conexibacter sp. CPCC 205706]MDO8196682.1 mandelate racemase/muconate lactonizing enzyme family protein [Conexibacter sp. CPCC 205762]MDR9372664.1 mandelate racemase/muconate lactonizing enzyme family protein [Conexibacter sp. JD483]
MSAPALTIADVEVLILDGGVEYGTATADGERSGPRHWTLIRVTSEEGHVGWADVDSHPWIVKAIVEAHPHIPDFCSGLKDAVVGLSAWDRHHAWERMYQASWYHGRRGPALHAISGIDVALWDLAARAAGVPVAQLLGGRRRDSVQAYASTLFRETPDEMRAATRRYLDQGFRAIKFGWGPWGADARRDHALLAAAREEAGPDVKLMVDGHIAGDAAAVRAHVRALEELAPFWVEEPLPADRPGELAQLGRSTSLRVASGEQLGGISEYAELLREPGVAVVQPDLGRCGGYTVLQQVAELAGRAGALVVPHAWTSHLLTAATLQAAAWLPNEPLVEVNASTAPLVAQLAPLDLGLADGRVRVPSGPGLGVEVDPAVVDRYRVA